MSPELDEKLCKQYPKIFVNRNGDPKTTLMCWGFEVGDGWYHIIDTLCDSIQSYIDYNPSLNVPQVVAVQVKEKFGSLRFYVNGGNEFIDGMIHMTERLSATTCEQCGKPGKSRGHGWIYTACDEHTREEDLETDTVEDI